ncbi:hypothetical protein Q8A73_024099 [Channa argus]|nr:hypothetical protein Q8A73_024094 [Channa argus]KAK2875487.1 hypothetical protein Q8A73_024099 [Channa argus]
MAFANQGRTIPRVGLRRTLRFQWRSSDREVMPRHLFCTRIIKGQLNLTVEDVFCIQWHQQATGYDVSFVSAETHQAVTASSRFCCTQMLKVLKGFSTPLHSPAEAIRADASVRVTLVPGGGDLRVKLSQYTDDTTLLLDSDECVVRALEVLRIFEGSQELGSTLANVQRPLARTIFDFLWGGRYEWVALGRMMSGLAEGGRHVPDLPLKLDTIFVASLLQDMASEVGHPASIGPVNSLGGTAQDFEVPVEEQRQGSDAKGFVLHQNHQGPVESDGGGRFLYSVASAGNRVSGLVVDSSRFCSTQMFPVLLHPDAEEAIRADASVRVTLVPGGGDLRVKLSQYTDDTTLLLDSDECVVRALEVLRIFEGSQELGSTLANSRLALWKARKLTLLGKVLVLKADMLSSVLHLAYVFPLPVAIRRPLARTIFDFL